MAIETDHSEVFSPIRIKLFTLLRILWFERLLFLFSILVVTFIFTVFDFIIKPAYEARILWYPPGVRDVSIIGYSFLKDEDTIRETIAKIYSTFIRNARSDNYLREFSGSIF
ncbi:chain length determinant protein [Pseudomonas protegens Cab57]|uniref:Wzz/FepE/Etk N-terminal domain-containing protein n=1 Tax=Pseudomonas protegens TaxID=380021 RepID=UPI000442546F|nr:chain length determinant protein [Pseudomonas protegens Cab57]